MANLYDGNGNTVDIGGASNMPNLLKDKTWCQVGDSLTYFFGGRSLLDTNGFMVRMVNEFGMKRYVNYGSPGKMMYSTSDTSIDGAIGSSWGGVTSAQYMVENNETYDYVSFAYGTNDHLDKIGSPTDDASTYATSTCGAMKYIANLFNVNFPDTRFFFVLPPKADWSKWGDGSYNGVRDVNDEKHEAMLETARLLGVPVCDMYWESGITTDMLDDGVHFGGGDYDYDCTACDRYYKTLRKFMMTL